MKKRRKHHILFLVLICLICLFGCSRTRIIDKISIIHVFGFDQAENGELIGTALFPDYTMSKDGDQIQKLEEQAPTSILFVPKMSEYTSTPIELAKVRVLLLGRNFAEAGIQDMVRRLILNPQIGTHIQIAGSTHSAGETLTKFQKEKSLTLAERLQQNMQGQYLPYMTLHDFLNDFYGEGVDAYVPMVTIDEKDRVKIDGIGIFKGDKLKLHLNPDQTTLFSYIEDKRTQATYKMVLDDKNRGEIVTVRAFHSKSKWDWDQKKERINLRLQLQMTLTQYPDRFDLKKEQVVMEMKKLIEEKLEKDLGNLLGTLKENGVDPLGIGNIVRSKDRTWEKAAFYEQYPTLPISVNVDLKILHSGLEG
ncbi:Ger(x)C family spore germination protein [Mesobacillus maritimus]|uniref:Ger(x)C family spore germination protein n=1 Tax=Mesobacillus maritimus TaxID=1643336 RepID=UPI00203C6A01|nr:Ger(x)C family spore germination protein [Mesobacillus maritimus]MCM3584699.1 Ger(x)C family spore germination protein [Mesobacillus maritimus]MCM3671299.1 Ger(x)C family spore germination protein [Mesobacillus maritimus]